MNPIVMALLLILGWGIFVYSAWRRWKLMMVGTSEDRFDRPGARLGAVWTYAIAQLRMRRYPLAGYAHMIIFFGFLVLLLRSLMLWGQGFDESFSFWIFGTEQILGKIYSLLKDVFAVLVFLAALVFVYYRMITRLSRMTLSTEGLIIIWIIVVMMVADVLYDGALIAQQARGHGAPGVALAPRHFGTPSVPDPPGARTLRRLDVGEVRAVTAEPAEALPDLDTLDVEQIRVEPPEEAVDLDAFEAKEIDYQTEPESPLARRVVSFHAMEPAGSVVAMMVQGLSDGALNCLRHVGFWTHVLLVLIFLNLLPYSKHFHVITAIPNVYTQNLKPPGRLPPIEDIEGRLEREETLGIKRIDQFSWKSILDFYTCTECGRCSDHCPATSTGKKLSPKHFTLDLRDFLYKHDKALVNAKSSADDGSEPRPLGSGNEIDGDPPEHHKDLVDGVIDPEVLWACTSCRACEQECPVLITYVDKIVDMRRYLVQERGELPNELQTAFRCLEASFNPWGFPAEERAKWAEGLDVKTLADHPDAEVILWVGCAPAFDDRAKKVTRATARLMQKAGVDFAILGNEEQCTGDVARRAGNEYLFQMFAQQNVETLNRYGADKKKIVTTCPHCYNMLQHEYGDFGGNYDVIHHTTFLADLLARGRLKPSKPVDKKVAFHDSCYLGRYNDIYEAPREALQRIPGLTLVEPAETRDRGMCCGAGGAQMFKEEESGDQRVNAARTQQLLETGPDAIASACPFCMRMLIDGLADKDREDLPQLDVAEILLESVEAEQPTEAES
ncbi:MAG: (Fe-S)-binding protein [Phycisphaerales bacterium]|nr:MAG: (Fe-S)-binding protein [Phycisphaerales bacterium]